MSRLGLHLARWLSITAAIVAAGAIIGAISFPAVGALLGLDHPPAALARFGASQLAFYAFVWAPGTSIVLCIMLAARDRHRRSRP